MYAYSRDMHLIFSCMKNLPYTLADPLCCSWQFFDLYSSKFPCSVPFFPPLARREFPFGDGELSLRKSFSATKICEEKGRSKYFLDFRVVTCRPQWGRSLARSQVVFQRSPKLLLSRSPNSSLPRSHRPRSFVVFEFLRSLVRSWSSHWCSQRQVDSGNPIIRVWCSRCRFPLISCFCD